MYAHYQPAITGIGDRFGYLIRRLLLGGADPQGLSFLTLGSLLRVPLEAVLVPLGLVVTLWSAWTSRKNRRDESPVDTRLQLGIVIWWLATMVAIGLWLPQDWERYYLPALPPTVLLAARGIVGLGELLSRRARVITSSPS